MNNLSIRKKNELSKKKKKGFTLVELIIVIAIIAILAAIAIPKFGQIRENANIKSDIATAKTIQTAVLTGLANSQISVPDADGTAVTDAQLQSVLEGGVIPKAKASATAVNAKAFKATVDKDGTVKVLVDTIQVLPVGASPYNS